MLLFACDLGHDGPRFPWDDEDRRHLQAALDALSSHLSGLSRNAACYVLNSFPIVRRDNQQAFGQHRTCDIILTYMNALAAGDTDMVPAA